MRQLLGVVLILLAGTACTSLKVAEVDPTTGHFPGNKSATVALNKPFDLDSRNNLIVVGKSDFLVNQLKNIHYFKEVITVDELETKLVQANLTDKISSVSDKIGLNKAAKYYKPFMWLHVESRRDGNNKYVQFVLTDPLALEDYFITESYLDFIWTGVNDQNNWYPMFNALIDYIAQNSKIYGRQK